jgi:hypothetical protein
MGEKLAIFCGFLMGINTKSYAPPGWKTCAIFSGSLDFGLSMI